MHRLTANVIPFPAYTVPSIFTPLPEIGIWLADLDAVGLDIWLL